MEKNYNYRKFIIIWVIALVVILLNFKYQFLNKYQDITLTIIVGFSAPLILLLLIVYVPDIYIRIHDFLKKTKVGKSTSKELQIDINNQKLGEETEEKGSFHFEDEEAKSEDFDTINPSRENTQSEETDSYNFYDFHFEDKEAKSEDFDTINPSRENTQSEETDSYNFYDEWQFANNEEARNGTDANPSKEIEITEEPAQDNTKEQDFDGQGTKENEIPVIPKSYKNSYPIIDVTRLIALLIVADGHIANKETKQALKHLKKHVNWWQNYFVYRELNDCLQTKEKKAFFEDSCKDLNKYMDYSEKLGFMELLFDIARLGNIIKPVEWDFLNRVMERLGISKDDTNYFSRKYPTVQQSTTEASNEIALSPYNILGIDTNATTEEIRSAFFLLEKKYNPDTVKDENMKMVLAEKFKEIVSAFQALKK